MIELILCLWMTAGDYFVSIYRVRPDLYTYVTRFKHLRVCGGALSRAQPVSAYGAVGRVHFSQSTLKVRVEGSPLRCHRNRAACGAFMLDTLTETTLYKLRVSTQLRRLRVSVCWN